MQTRWLFYLSGGGPGRWNAPCLLFATPGGRNFFAKVKLTGCKKLVQFGRGRRLVPRRVDLGLESLFFDLTYSLLILVMWVYIQKCVLSAVDCDFHYFTMKSRAFSPSNLSNHSVFTLYVRWIFEISFPASNAMFSALPNTTYQLVFTF